jgi:hypothetical protein
MALHQVLAFKTWAGLSVRSMKRLSYAFTGTRGQQSLASTFIEWLYTIRWTSYRFDKRLTEELLAWGRNSILGIIDVVHQFLPRFPPCYCTVQERWAIKSVSRMPGHWRRRFWHSPTGDCAIPSHYCILTLLEIILTTRTCHSCNRAPEQ